MSYPIKESIFVLDDEEKDIIVGVVSHVSLNDGHDHILTDRGVSQTLRTDSNTVAASISPSGKFLHSFKNGSLTFQFCIFGRVTSAWFCWQGMLMVLFRTNSERRIAANISEIFSDVMSR